MSSDDEIIVNFHDSVVKRSDLDLLDGPEWLSDNLINFFFQYLEKLEYKIHDGELAFVSPDLTHCIKMTDSNEVSVFIEPLGLAKKNLMFFPINDCVYENEPGGSHWSLLFYLRADNTFYHFDSFCNVNCPHGEIVKNRLLPYIDMDEMPLFTSAETPQQNNSYDCGIHVICTVEYICRKHLKGEKISIFEYCNKEKIESKRAWLKSLILSFQGRKFN